MDQRDRAAMEAAMNGHPEPESEKDDTADQTDPNATTLADYEARIEHLEQRVGDLERELEETSDDDAAVTAAEFSEFKKEVFSQINALKDDIEGRAKITGSNTLEKFASLSLEEREELLGPTQRRAVKLYDHWDEIAWTNSEYDTTFVDTQSKAMAKYNPAKIKFKLDRLYDAELTWNEIYRILKSVAKLSGGQETVDDHGRVHITGGDFEFREVPTADTAETRKVLKEVRR